MTSDTCAPLQEDTTEVERSSSGVVEKCKDAIHGWALLVIPSEAKGVRDVLKKVGWLDQMRKAAMASSGRMACPLLPAGLEPLRAADLNLSGCPPILVEIDFTLEWMPLPPNKPPPPQKGVKAQDKLTLHPRAPTNAKPKAKVQERSFGSASDKRGGGQLPPATSVRRVVCPPGTDAEWLSQNVFAAHEPVVLEGMALGACVGLWTPAHLSKTVCSLEKVSIHVCTTDLVDLAGHRLPGTPRNFVFRSVPFQEAVVRCAASEYDGDKVEPAEPEPIVGTGEWYYLRSVGANSRKDKADFPSLFPDLARECALPGPFVPDGMYHSSVLRVTSAGARLWTHFDVMDNLLASITGRKRVILWPPEEDKHLYVEGSSSRVADVDSWNDEEFPLFRRSIPSRLECELGPGEVLFLPALWFHNVTNTTFTAAVNVFWHSHEDNAGALWDAKDLYGNRDPPAAVRAEEFAAGAVDELLKLPEPFRSFYAARVARDLLGLASQELKAVPAIRCPSVELNSGASMPLVGLGTYRCEQAQVGDAILAALRAGMRHFDCASIYSNQRAVGEAFSHALASGIVRRDELFVTSKLWNADHGRVREACLRSLADLQLDTLDLYLLHWPPQAHPAAPPLVETWRAMEGLVREGLVRSIGVSNFSSRKLEGLLDLAEVAPAVNQVEMHPRWRNDKLLACCLQRGVHLTAHSPLGGDRALLEDSAVQSLSESLRCSPAQLLLRWILDRDCSVVFKSSSCERIQENFACGSAAWALPGDCRLDRLSQARVVDGAGFKGCTFDELWDEDVEHHATREVKVDQVSSDLS